MVLGPWDSLTVVDQGISAVVEIGNKRFQKDPSDEELQRRRLASAMRKISNGMVERAIPTDALRSAAIAMENAVGNIHKYPLLSKSQHSSGDAEAFAEHGPVLGQGNPRATDFLRYEMSKDSLEIDVNFSSTHEGPPSGVHGGSIASVFDEIMANCQLLSGSGGMTKTLMVAYKAKTPLNTKITFRAKVTSFSNAKVEVHADCHSAADPSKRVLAEATGIFKPLSVGTGPSNSRSKL